MNLLKNEKPDLNSKPQGFLMTFGVILFAVISVMVLLSSVLINARQTTNVYGDFANITNCSKSVTEAVVFGIGGANIQANCGTMFGSCVDFTNGTCIACGSANAKFNCSGSGGCAAGFDCNTCTSQAMIDQTAVKIVTTCPNSSYTFNLKYNPDNGGGGQGGSGFMGIQ